MLDTDALLKHVWI